MEACSDHKMYKIFVSFLFTLLYLKGTNGDPVSQEIATDDIYRLSDSIIPLHYDLYMATDLRKSFFAGLVNITVMVNVPTKSIELHSKDLKIYLCKVTTGSRTLSSKYHLDLEKDLFVIEFPRKLAHQIKLIISINFRGQFNDRQKGYVNSSYKIDGMEKRLAFTNLEPNHAREVFPCFDEPKFRAQFTIHMVRHAYQTAISNMPLRITTNDSTIKDLVWDEFDTTPAMPTYLVAFTISELTHTSDPENIISIWARKNAIKKLDFSFNQSVQCLKLMENMTGIPYMLTKLDMVAIPQKMGYAMENWRMITFDEALLITTEDTSLLWKMQQTQIQCNEIAHQWFGDLVTLEWWDNLRIKQGFAIYYKFFATAKINPSWRTDELFVTGMVHAALWLDVENDRSMTMPVTRKSQLVQIYDTTTYLPHILSTDSFHQFVHNFLIKGRDDYHGVVNQDRLFQVLENQVITDHISLPPNTSISQIMRTWTENSGYPLISVTRHLTSNTVELIQTTYKTPRAPKPQLDHQWIVPISYTTSLSPQFVDTKPTLWSFAEKPVQIPHKVPNSDWVLCNLQHSGYYRVNYDIYNWNLLTAQLIQNHTVLHPLSRAQLLDDSFTLAYDGKLPYMIPLQMALYLPLEKDIIPWSAVLFHLLYAYGRFLQESMQTPSSYFIQLLIKNIYQSTGFQTNSKDSELIGSVRSQIVQLACTVQLPECLEQAIDEYQENKDDLNNIHQDLKLTVFQTALRHASDSSDVENKLSSLYEEAGNIADRKIILLAAGSSGNRVFLNEILSKTATHETIEFFEKLNNFETLSSTNIITACLEKLHDGVSTMSDLPSEDVTLLKLLAARLHLKTENETQLSLLRRLKNKLGGFEHT